MWLFWGMPCYYEEDEATRQELHAFVLRERSPWREALGADLDELEARWLESLWDGAPGSEERVGRLARILNAGRGDPCERARRMAGQGR